MKKIILFILLALIAISCGDDDENIEKQIDLSDTYLPLEVGNQWQYEYYANDSTANLSLKVIGKTTINNKEYFEVENLNLLIGYGEYKDEKTFIRSSDGITFYALVENEEKIFRIYDEVDVTENIFHLRLRGNYFENAKFTVSSIFGDLNSFFISSINFPEIDGGYDEYSLKGIGIVGRGAECIGICNMQLNYCKVGDKEYGEKV